MRQVNVLLETLICGRRKFRFDLTFAKVVAANTMKFCFYNEGRESYVYGTVHHLYS